MLAAIALLLVACGEDTVGEGEGCASAQDCEGALVCAKLDADSEDMVCAMAADTRADVCDPGDPCGLVLKGDDES